MQLSEVDNETLIQLFGYARDEAQLDAIEAEITRRGIYGRKRQPDNTDLVNGK